MPAKSATADIIVAGLGAHGSSTVYHAAKRGKRVIGFDKFTPPHDHGSSHGKGRVIRSAYREGPAYVPLVQRAFTLWRELEHDAGERLLQMTGGVTIARRGSPGLDGIRHSARAYNLFHETLSAQDIRRRWPSFRPEDDMEGVYEADNGALFPEKCVAAHLKLAARAGADLHFNEPVLSWKATPDGVEVKTAHGAYMAERLVLTVGAWLPRLLNDVTLPLSIERQVLHWFAPARNAASFKPENFPTNSWEYDNADSSFYCQADFGDGVKVAFHHGGASIDPDSAPGSKARTVTAAEVEAMRTALTRYVPDAGGKHLGSAVCIYTNVPDYHFLVDFHPRHRQVIIGSPCSGHGFKFSSIMGEVLSGLAIDGRSDFDLSLFSAKRFAVAKV